MGLDTMLHYGVIDHFQIGLGVELNSEHFEAENDVNGKEIYNRFGYLGAVTANIRTSGAAIPYLRVSMGSSKLSGNGYDDSIKNRTRIGPRFAAGMRALIGGSASLNIELDFNILKDANGVTGIDAKQLYMAFGFSIFPWVTERS